MENINEDIEEEGSPRPGVNMRDICSKVKGENGAGWVQTQQELFPQNLDRDNNEFMDKQKIHPEILKGPQNMKQYMLKQKILCFKGSDDGPELPEEFTIDQAVGGGDCFFDSVAKGLKLLKPELDVSVKSLRKVCKRFAQRESVAGQSWLKEALKNETEPISEYIRRIEFTANDIEQNSASVNVLGLSAPIWGRSEIEGRIICMEYNVLLHIIEKHVVEGKVVWLNQIIDSDGSRCVDDIDYSQRNTVHIINNGKAHFQPILGTQTIQELEEGNLVGQVINLTSESNDSNLHFAELPTNQQLLERPTTVHVRNHENEESEKGILKLNSDHFNSRNNSNHKSVIDSNSTSVQNSGTSIIKHLYTDIDIKEESSLENGDDLKQQLFRRRPGTSGISGQLYEINLLILFLLQGTKGKKSFYLATNVKEAGDFDDVVLKYKTNARKTNIIFLQAKHRENPEKDKITIEQLFSESEKGDFNLKKYFKSFLKIKQQFLGGRKDEIFGNEFQEVDFIIFTNARSTFNKTKESIEKVALEQDSILNWSENGSYFYKLVTEGKNNEKRISVLQHSSDCKKLAEKLVKSIISQQGLCVNEGILRDYHIPLFREVIERKPGAKEGKIKESFLNSDSEFTRIFFEVVQKRNEFAEYSEAELISELQRKSIKLSENFGKINIREGKYPEFLPNDVVSESDIKEFLSKLKLFVDQYNEDELGKAVKEKIREEYKISHQDIDSVFSEVQNKVLGWWKKGNCYITETNRIFQDAARVSIKFDAKEPVTLFTGRITELQNLHKILQDGGEAVISQMASVTGLGGIGKTELARKYVSIHSKDYDDNVIWINADTYITIVESFLRLAQEKLQISTKDENGKEKEIRLIVWDVYWFFAKRHRKSIFIFDNAGKYKAIGKGEGIDMFLPSHYNKPFGKNKPFVLITSRFQEWGEIKSLPLDVFTEIEAVEFVRKALHNTLELDEIDVKRLVEELQYLPLALSQAVAYIQMENKELSKWKEGLFTISSYLEQFKEKANELLSKTQGEITEHYTKTVMTTWHVTIEKIKKKVCGKQALEVLSVMAYFAPNNIPIENIFSNLITEEETRHTAVELLDQYSMAHLEYGRLNIHRLVQHVTRVDLERHGKENEVIDTTFKLVHKSFPYDKDTVKDYLKQKELLQHLEAFLSCLDNLLVKRPEDGHKIEECYIENLLTWMGHGYFNVGHPRRQMELLERCLPIVEKHYSPDHYQVSTVLVNLSNAYWAVGDVVKQKDLLERALEIDEKHYGSDHYLFAKTLGNLGNCYKYLGNIQKQIELLERALEIEERHYGSDHFEVASTLGNLSTAYAQLGDTKKQKDLLERALEIEEKHFESDHVVIARTLENLSIAYGALGDHQKQKELLERALEINENHYGSDNFELAKTLLNLSNALANLGDVKKQKVLLEKVLEIQEKHYGSDHFEIAGTLVNLGIAYGALGDAQHKGGLLERALEICEKQYGSDNFQVAKILVNLGSCYGDLGDTKRQKELLERALEIKEKHYGANHFEVALTLVNLSNAYGDLGDPRKQKDLLERALEINEKHYGSDYFEVARTLVNLSNAYGALGDSMKQKTLLERAMPILEKHFGSYHYFLATPLENLGITYGVLGEHQKEKELLERALKINEKHYGSDHFKVAGTQVNLSNAYRALGETIKQKVLLEKALEINEKHYGSNHFVVARTLANLGSYYRDLGDYEKQKEFLEKALIIKENHYGSDHFEVGHTLASLSTAYQAVGDTEKQKDLLERALEIKEKYYGSNHHLLVTTIENLGVAYGELGDYEKQKELLERAFEITEEHFGTDHFQVARKLVNLGNAFGELGDPHAQKHLQERALKIQEKHYGSDHYEVAVTLVNLSDIYGELGDDTKQKQLLERALEIEEKHYGSDHIKVARTLVSLGNYYRDLGEHEKHKEFLKRALEIKENHYGSDHYLLASTMENLGIGYGALGDYEKQKELLEKAFKITEEHFGLDHFQVARKLVNLGSTFWEIGDPHAQKQLQERALKIQEKYYGSDHYEVAGTLMILSFAYRDLGDVKKQKDLLERALEIKDKHNGSDHIEVAEILVNLGIAYGALGDIKKKEGFLVKALEIYEKRCGSDHDLLAKTLVNMENYHGNFGDSEEKTPENYSEINEKLYGSNYFEVARTVENMSNAYKALGDAMKQRDLLQRTLPIVEKHFGLDHYFFAKSLENLGTAHGELGDHRKEKELLERALKINEKHYGSDHFKVAGTQLNLSSAYGALGETMKQKILLERALEISEKHYGSDHFEVGRMQVNLGNTYGELGDNQARKQLLEQALKIQEKHYGLDHYEVAVTLVNLSHAYRDLGDSEKSEDFLKRALKIIEKNYRSDRDVYAKTLKKLGIALGKCPPF